MDKEELTKTLTILIPTLSQTDCRLLVNYISDNYVLKDLIEAKTASKIEAITQLKDAEYLIKTLERINDSELKIAYRRRSLILNKINSL